MMGLCCGYVHDQVMFPYLNFVIPLGCGLPVDYRPCGARKKSSGASSSSRYSDRLEDIHKHASVKLLLNICGEEPEVFLIPGSIYGDGNIVCCD